MLRRTSTAIASAAALSLIAAPAFASPAASHASSGKFTVPAASSAVKGWGTYHKINAHRMHLTVCAKKLHPVFAIGVEAVAYNANYSRHSALAAVILPETPGQAGCVQMNVLYTAHLKVFSFIGQGGRIVKKTKMKTIF